MPSSSAQQIFNLRVLILFKSAPVCSLKFTLRATTEQADRRIIRWKSGRRYNRAFLSYSSVDREEVVASAVLLHAVRISFFHDLLTLEPGDRWKRRIYEEIDHCDLVLLFWSSHAKKSKWVLKETQYALARRSSSSDESPVLMTASFTCWQPSVGRSQKAV
jgi:hypothetical protein